MYLLALFYDRSCCFEYMMTLFLLSIMMMRIALHAYCLNFLKLETSHPDANLVTLMDVLTYPEVPFLM